MKHKLIRTKSQKIAALCLLPFLAAAGLLAAKAAYARFVLPWMPPCMIRTATGWRCPSCGMTHAVFALCRGDIIESVRQNAILMFGVTLGILRYMELWLSTLAHPKRLIPRKGNFWIGVLIFWLGYAILRNLI